MDIVKTKEGEKLVVVLNGRLDTVTAPQLEAELDLSGVKELVFDIAGLDYVSSAGLRLFLSSQKTMSKVGTMVIRGAKPIVKEVFDITGFTDILTIE